jgi:acyl-CoA reductase-like NAD-dependent aldehyde dehydrogenase
MLLRINWLLRFNVEFMTQIYGDQPTSTSDMWNRLEYRPLEGFVYAITPFNFTAIAQSSCKRWWVTLLFGNQVTAKYSQHKSLLKCKEAGVPDGVINVVLESQEWLQTLFWQVVILLESTLQDRLMSLKIFGLKLELTSITKNIPKNRRRNWRKRFYYRSLKC